MEVLVGRILKNKKIWIYVMLSMLFCGIFIIKDYTQDSYLCFQDTWKEPFIHFLTLGRVNSGIFWLILSKTNYSTLIFVSGILAIWFLSLSMYITENIIKNMFNYINKKYNEIFVTLISIIIILNIFVIELFVWYEKGIMLLSVLSSIIALRFLQKFLENDKKFDKNIIMSFVFMLIANFSYQGTLGIFISIGSLLIIVYSKNVKKFLLNGMYLIFNYIIPSVINILFIKSIFHTNRVVVNDSIFDKIKQIFKASYDIIINSYDIIPKYYFLLMILISIIIFMYLNFFVTKDIKSKILNILELFMICFVTYIASVAPQFFQNGVNIVPRTFYSFATLWGIIVLFNYLKFENNNAIFIFNKILIGIFILVQLYNFAILEIDHYITNYIDLKNANEILNYIEEYEKNTGNKIEKIYRAVDKEYKNHYKGIRPLGEGNIKAFNSTWGLQGIMETVSNRKFNIKDSDNLKINEEFKEKNWDYFNKEQLIFNNNELYICVY